ncbi:MAG: OmpA family protein [Syntrophotaleaceae bacterium]
MVERRIALFVVCLVLAALAHVSRVAEAGFFSTDDGTEIREGAAAGEGAEGHLPSDRPLTPWLHDPSIFEEAQGDRIEMRQELEQEVKTIKLENMVPPILFPLGVAEIPEDYVERLRSVLHDMRDRTNVRLHLVGHADPLSLTPALEKIFGDNVGLSRERAGTVAEYFQQALGLPPEAISYEGMGDSRPVASNATEGGRRLNRRVEVQVWYDEISEKLVEKEVVIPFEVHRVLVCRTETVCKMRYLEGHAHRARIKNLIAPLHYQQGLLEVPESFLQQVRQAMKNLGNKQNLAVKFTAHTDALPLEGRDKRIYGDQLGFSKAVARRVLLAVQGGLELPNAAVECEGRGAAQPVASNETQQGRALNRRVEVEFWYDDPLQELPDEPQLCPDTSGGRIVTRVYESPEGPVEPILFENGQPLLPAACVERLRRSMGEVADKDNVRLRFVGYTRNQRLDRRTAAVYGDDVGLSTARARRAMDVVCQSMSLSEEKAEFEGRGYVQSDDVVNAGFIESDTSRVQVQVVYDELVPLDDYEGVEITPITREVEPADPFSLNLMRITVDGAPLDDPGKCSSDVQRCTDVALEDARIRFKHDNLQMEPRLNVTAWPRSIGREDLPETDFVENQVEFRLYANYRSFIHRAEVRIFDREQSVRDLPLAVIEMNDNGMAQWQPAFETYATPVRQLEYLVRVYDEAGNYDETATQPLWVVDRIDPAIAEADRAAELLAGYGESRLARRNIPLKGGVVQAFGSAIPAGFTVWLAGRAVPVDAEGRFVAEEILPEGMHTVEVAVLDESGNGQLYLRDLELKKSDWFTVGIADLTLSGHHTTGPADLVAPDNEHYSEDAALEGRLAFYSKGRFGEGWKLTASADTREGPLDEIFTNFLDKSPDALFRRLDPDRHYPTFGDDGTVIEDAPTNGKFYLRLEKEENYGVWGNFKIAYTDNYLAHVDRGLYGGNLHYQSRDVTSFGEQRFWVDGFAADPGTIAGRDELRGTGGSLYYLRRQDILEGSESVRIEVRDKDSGVVLAVKNLSPTLDYDIDYLQGRVLLAEPLASTASDNLLVMSDSTGGHPAFLVVRYEFTPGVDELDTMAFGGRAHYWLNDYIKFGVTADRGEEEDVDKNLYGADVTLRKSAQSWVRLEAGRSEGPGVATTTSVDGGYTIDPVDSAEAGEALAYRVDTSIGVQDFFAQGRGRFTLYYEMLEADYAAPGLITDRDLTRYGGTGVLPLFDRFNLRFKTDFQVQKDGLETEAGELDVEYRAGEHWTLSSGVRRDSREDNSAVVPETQEEGDRTDVVARILYDSRSRWSAYGFAQGTVQATGTREDNNRLGAGGSLRVTDRFKVEGELSHGDLGTGASLGTEYLYSDRTTVYLNYALENERSDNGLLARKGNLASGFRTRYSDSASVFLEERYTHGEVPTGLVHSTGVDLAPTDRLNFGANLDVGTLKDPQTGAELDRKAAGIRMGYGFDSLKLASAVEYRVDDSEQADASTVERTTWLFKNSLKYQMSSDWRLLGKFDHSFSESSQGQFYDGNYTEGVLGFAYRPVKHDRLNALMKYTYFYNVPAPDQVSTVDSGSDVIQRSHIFALDLMYDLTPRWTVGGKVAYRQGEVSQDREDPEFFSSRAHLYVLRADWHFLHRWDALLEARMLDLPDAEDSLSGALVGVYRHFGNHIKLGVGYNFSKFSDDLTDLNYDHQGLFINLIGKM